MIELIRDHISFTNQPYFELFIETTGMNLKKTRDDGGFSGVYDLTQE